MTEPLTLAQRLDALRIKAFKSNSADDTAIYYNQLSLAFQRGELVDASTVSSLRGTNKALTEELAVQEAAKADWRDECNRQRQQRSAAEAKLAKVEAELALADKSDMSARDLLNDVEADTMAAEAELSIVRKDRARLSAELAEVGKLLRPFARIAEAEDFAGTKNGESILVNVNLCRSARSFLASKEASQ